MIVILLIGPFYGSFDEKYEKMSLTDEMERTH